MSKGVPFLFLIPSLGLCLAITGDKYGRVADRIVGCFAAIGYDMGSQQVQAVANNDTGLASVTL